MAVEKQEQQKKDSGADFLAESDKPPLPIWKEFLEFLIHQPSWWLVPLILVMLLLGLAVVMIPAEALPFIYTLW